MDRSSFSKTVAGRNEVKGMLGGKEHKMIKTTTSISFYSLTVQQSLATLRVFIFCF